MTQKPQDSLPQTYSSPDHSSREPRGCIKLIDGPDSVAIAFNREALRTARGQPPSRGMDYEAGRRLQALEDDRQRFREKMIDTLSELHLRLRDGELDVAMRDCKRAMNELTAEREKERTGR